MWNGNIDQDSVNDEYRTTASFTQDHNISNSKTLTLMGSFCVMENECEKRVAKA
jgi:hypothetical protein